MTIRLIICVVIVIVTIRIIIIILLSQTPKGNFHIKAQQHYLISFGKYSSSYSAAFCTHLIVHCEFVLSPYYNIHWIRNVFNE